MTWRDEQRLPATCRALARQATTIPFPSKMLLHVMRLPAFRERVGVCSDIAPTERSTRIALISATPSIELCCTDSFSALGIRNYKNFLRMKFEKDKLTIYPLGIDKVPGPDHWMNAPDRPTLGGLKLRDLIEEGRP